MARNNGKLRVVGGRKETDDEVDELFSLPLAEFTSARNALAARLKKAGRGDDAALVKALTKPPISAWTVNQLYWKHREAFERLIESGVRFHKAQSSRSAGKVADMRFALDARREALTQLSDLATSLLEDAGHNAAPETIHRITTSLEALSVYASRSDAPRPGRLTADVDPPGFESLGAFTGAGMITKPSKAIAAEKPNKTKTETDTRKLEAARKAKIAAAKISLQEAKRSLSQAQDREQRLKATQKKADAEARAAEQRLEKARAASEDACKRLRGLMVEVKEATKSVEEAERGVEMASEELENAFGRL